MEKNIQLFKLAGLRAGAVAKAAAQDSLLVRWAMQGDLFRQQFKHYCKRFFSSKCSGKTNQLRILVHIRGGMGDVIMTRPFVRVLRSRLPQAEISFCYDSQTIAQMVFPDLIDRYQSPNYRSDDFDLVIQGSHLLFFTHYDKKRLEQLAPGFLPVLEEGLSVQSCFQELERYTPYLDGQLAEIATSLGGNRITNLGWSTGLAVSHADITEIPLDKEIFRQVLHKFGLAGKRYITIHDGINTNTDTSLGRPTRCWPVSHWRTFAEEFKAQFPDIVIVQLGGNKSQVFDFVDLSLVGKTVLQDLPHILKQAILHVDGESGMVHLARVVNTPSIVLFGPTNLKYLEYKENTNLFSPKCGGCMNISKNWMTTCILHFPHEQQCLAAISPQTVLEAVKNRLKN